MNESDGDGFCNVDNRFEQESRFCYQDNDKENLTDDGHNFQAPVPPMKYN